MTELEKLMKVLDEDRRVLYLAIADEYEASSSEPEVALGWRWLAKYNKYPSLADSAYLEKWVWYNRQDWKTSEHGVPNEVFMELTRLPGSTSITEDFHAKVSTSLLAVARIATKLIQEGRLEC